MCYIDVYIRNISTLFNAYTGRGIHYDIMRERKMTRNASSLKNSAWYRGDGGKRNISSPPFYPPTYLPTNLPHSSTRRGRILRPWVLYHFYSFFFSSFPEWKITRNISLYHVTPGVSGWFVCVRTHTYEIKTPLNGRAVARGGRCWDDGVARRARVFRTIIFYYCYI